MIQRFIHAPSKSVTSAAIIVGLAGLASRFLGVVRDRILAGAFGAGDTLDVYYAAFRIPDLVFNLLVLGALSAGFIPVLSKYLKRGKREEDRMNEEATLLTNNVFHAVAVALVIICAVLAATAPIFVPFMTPGFDAEKMRLTILLSRIMFFSPIFLGISSIAGGILQSFRRFFIYSLAPIFYNLGIIIGALVFVPRFGIEGLAWGVVLGALLHFSIQLPTVFHLGYRHFWTWNPFEAGVRLIGKLMIPRTLALATSQLNLLVITIIASTLEGGSIAIFNLANNLQNFPIGIFAIAYSIAVFPSLSEHAAEGDTASFIRDISQTLRQILFFIIPSAILFLLLRAQIVRVILGSGVFDWTATIRTADALAFFSLSLFAQALIPLFARSFYALQNTAIPFVIGLVSAAVNILASLLFAPQFGIAGLALAFSIANIINFVLLWIALRLKLGELDEMNIFVSVVKMSVAAFLMSIAVQGLKNIIAPFVDFNTFRGIFTQGFTAGVLGIFVYFFALHCMKSSEFFAFRSGLAKRLFQTKLPSSGADESRGV